MHKQHCAACANAFEGLSSAAAANKLCACGNGLILLAHCLCRKTGSTDRMRCNMRQCCESSVSQHADLQSNKGLLAWPRNLSIQSRPIVPMSWDKTVAQAAPVSPCWKCLISTKSPITFRMDWTATHMKGAKASCCANKPACTTTQKLHQLCCQLQGNKPLNTLDAISSRTLLTTANPS